MNSATAAQITNPIATFKLDRIWAELTGKCQLECIHCYAESGPQGSHGNMTAANWMDLIDQASDLGAAMVQ